MEVPQGHQRFSVSRAARKGILRGIVHKGMAPAGVHYAVVGVITVKTVQTITHYILKKVSCL